MKTLPIFLIVVIVATAMGGITASVLEWLAPFPEIGEPIEDTGTWPPLMRIFLHNIITAAIAFYGAWNIKGI